MWQAQGDVLCWDIGYVIGMLKEHPNHQLLIDRAMRSCNHGYQSMNHTIEIMWDNLVDDFMCYSINSFQDVLVSGFDQRRLTQAEIVWCNLQEKARGELWVLTRPLAANYAGSMITYSRTGGLIHIFAQTN